MIIIYFSQSGTTKAAAEQLHSVLNVPIYQIEPVKAYPADFSELAEVTKLEVAKQVQPDLKRMAIDLPEDHKIILGFPTWRHQPPMLIERFFAVNDLKGQQIFPFTTSSDDLIGKSLPFLNDWAGQAQATIGNGGTLNSQTEIERFAKEVISVDQD